MPELVVVVPTYNEATNLDSIIGRIRAAVPDATVLVVDDASPDGTGALADAWAARDDHVQCLHRAGKDGLGVAYRDGFQWARNRGATWVAQIDADGSHNPNDLVALCDIARTTGAALVLGSRWVAGGAISGWSRIREAISRTGNSYSRMMLKSQIRDLTAGFRVIRTDILREIDIDRVASSGYCFQVEVAHRIESHGALIVEHPITFTERASGVSKMHAGIVVEALLRVTVWGVQRWLNRRGN